MPRFMRNCDRWSGGTPATISIRVQNGHSIEDDEAFESGGDQAWVRPRRPPRSVSGEFWTEVGARIRYIDESARSSVASESRLHSRCTSGSTGSQDNFLLHYLTPSSRVVSSVFLAVDQSDHDQHYSSLTTLTLSDRQFSAPSLDTAAGEPLTPYRTPSAGQPSTSSPSYIPAVPLKSCLVELDPRVGRVTCSCNAVIYNQQLSFEDQNLRNNNEYSHQFCEDREVTFPNGQFYQPQLPKSSEEMPSSDALDAQSQYSVYMQKDCRYYFQHPLARLFVAFFIIFCNFLIFAEDPVSHSHTESAIPVVGNVFAFVLTKYPPEWQWRTVKIALWIAAIVTGMILGKHIIHKFLAQICRLKMFHDEQGSWMIMFLTVIVLLYVFSYIYNTVLLVAHPEACKHQITALMGITNSSLMKAAACGTWLGDFVTAWMVTDMMLQDNLYPNWAPFIRAFWRQGNTRIIAFWGGAFGMSALVVTLIVSDWINWDKLNRDFVATTELSRAFLASFILVMDLLIVMQDWDFPHFISTLDINLPGLKIKAVRLKICNCPTSIQKFWRIHITGKWFNYGIIFLVMILDWNMWKNQIFYTPEDYGQYIGHDFKVYTVSDYEVLATGNRTLWTYEWRSTHIDPATNRSLKQGDMLMNSRYLMYPMEEKCTTLIPSVIGFLMFGTLVYLYGRFPPKKSENLGGRLKRRKEQYRSSWRRERGSFYDDPKILSPLPETLPQSSRNPT